MDPFKILKKVGDLAYRVALSLVFALIHSVFHISMLKQYVFDLNHSVEYEPLQLIE